MSYIQNLLCTDQVLLQSISLAFILLGILFTGIIIIGITLSIFEDKI